MQVFTHQAEAEKAQVLKYSDSEVLIQFTAVKYVFVIPADEQYTARDHYYFDFSCFHLMLIRISVILHK